MKDRTSDYFLKKTDSLAYIELKSINSSGRPDELYGIPLPIYSPDLTKGIIDGAFGEEVDLRYVLDGIILNLAMDPEFKYAKEYRKILIKQIKTLDEFLLYEGTKLMQSNSEKAIYYFKLLYDEELGSSFGNYNYARLLYLYGVDENLTDLQRKAQKILHEIIEEDESFPLSYYELGRIMTYEGYHLKALAYFNKALTFEYDDNTRKLIESEVMSVQPLADIEIAISAIGRGDLEKARLHLLNSKDMSDTGQVNFYLGLVMNKLGLLEEALEYYRTALDKDYQERDLFLDMSVLYYRIGSYKSALTAIADGLKLHHEDTQLLYNRMLINLNLNRMTETIKDIDTILQYGDIPADILQNIIEIKRIYGI